MGIHDRYPPTEGNTSAVDWLFLLDAAFPNRREPVWLYLPSEDHFLLCCRGWELLGLACEAVGVPVDLGTHCLQADRTRYALFLEEMASTQANTVDAVFRFPVLEGRLSPVRFIGSRIQCDGYPLLYTGVLTVEEDSRRELDLRRLAFSDPLTSLPARNLFLYRVNVWLSDWESGHLGWMGTLHLNRYRRIRHLYGDNRLDHLIQVMASRLSAFKPELEISRSSGNEFLLAWHGPAAGFNADVMAQAVMDLFREPCDMGTTMMAVSVSLGYTVFEAGTQAEQAMLACESALQEALLQSGSCMRAYTE